MKLIDIIKLLKPHQLALDPGEQYSLSSCAGQDELNTTQSARCNGIADGKEQFGDTRPTFRIPHWTGFL